MKLLILYVYYCIRKHDEFITENRHVLYHMADIRQNHVEEFNMFLILLVVSNAFVLVPLDRIVLSIISYEV